MTITRRWQAGFESNGTDSRDDELTSYSNATYVTISTEAVRTGTYALEIDSGAYYAKQTVTRTAQGRIGFAFMMESGSGNSNVIEFQDSQHTGDDAQFALVLDKTSGKLKLYTNDGSTYGDLQATGTAVLSTYAHGVGETWPTGGWYHIGIDFKLDGAAGWITVYVDGVQDINMTGDTIQSDMSGYIDVLRTGDGSWSSGVDVIYDDMYFDDTAGEGAAAIVPDRKFHYLRANANGSNSGLTGSDGDQTNNYLLVDEMPHDSDTTYVGDTALVSTLRDSYGIGTVTLDAGSSIEAVIPVAFARKGDAGTNTGGVMLRNGTAEWDGGTTTLTTSYSMMWARSTVQPGSTAVWSQATLDAAEAGVVSYP